MQLIKKHDTCNIYGVNTTADNGISWEQAIGTPYILICIIEGENSSRDEFEKFLSKAEKNLQPNIENYFEGGSVILKSVDYGVKKYKINKSGVIVAAFAADIQNGELIVYGLANNGNLMENFCIMRTHIDVMCKRVTFPKKAGGFIIKKYVDIASYEVEINVRGVYQDGDVYYEMNGFRYPVPKSVIGKKFYIKADADVPKFGKISNYINLSVPLAI